jgi:hypothetical protein
MMDPQLDKIAWHIRAALEWARAVSELFPALWDAAKVFSPLVVDFCETCHKPLTVLWIPVGDHDLCETLQDPQDRGALYVNNGPLPPL